MNLCIIHMTFFILHFGSSIFIITFGGSLATPVICHCIIIDIQLNTNFSQSYYCYLVSNNKADNF